MMKLKSNKKEPTWLSFAKREIGVAEFKGKGRSNPRIEEYHQSTNVGKSDDSVAWCSSFANFCIESAGLVGTGSALARSWLKWGKKIRSPKLGCIVVLKSGSKSWMGHVGFYVGAGTSDGTIKVLGGNQSDRVSVVEYSVNKVLGYRIPKRILSSKVVIGNVIGGGGTATVVDGLTGGHGAEILKELVSVKEKLQTQADQIKEVINEAAEKSNGESYLIWIMLFAVLAPQIFSIYDRVQKNRKHGV